nr:ribonuclease H-like domain-containing protein [Tanacetum cinerariifolium]
GNPQQALKDKGVIDSGCSRHMTGNMSCLSDFEKLNGGYVAFGGNPKGGKITGKVLLRVSRENNMYNVNLKNIIPFGDLTCLFAKATLDESNLWHRRLGHVNFKTINKLVKGNLVRGLPSKVFTNDNSCVACKKGKQHRASCKSKTGIKREFSVPRTPQQNGITERKNKTFIKAAKTLLADSLLPILFWAKAVNTACYVQNRICGDQTREQGDKAENKDKGKSHVVTITGFRDLNEEFAECINNSNAAMPNLEDLSHNADHVGAEADTNNMQSIISVCPIPTTRIHKDHPTSQIIGDLSSTT